ncbi:hypothetical protein L207DRAFT_589090 [Hyaloscypha variabilis F]|uniref:Extracellular membrane protein CFEM domain-containing protein n=1 Tax=Hyaloscypha variabilis (strain UAMH 11265 / GT02V1 / F) TaxID=1149755 RepID=A0A2J6R7K6_HYAVF|nr:hypothetical protein L207DRAFT_589090 [Hyaloscypha variabilis F]
MFSKALISTALLPSLVYSQAENLNPGGAGCVDPSGYTSCYATSATNFGNCGQVCTQEYAPATKQFETCAAACSAANWATNIGCWLQSCWNRVYSCRYQGTAMQYIAGTDLEQTTLSHPIPYYPTPDGAPAACSCNLGLVYGNMTDQTIADIGSCVALGNGPDPSGTFDCDCCQTSQLISNIFNICPSSNLSSIGFDSWFADQEKSIKNSQVSYSEIAAMAGGGPLGNCTILNTPDTCVSKYKLPIEGTKWWNPLALPAGVPGTEALSDVAGSVTVPPWGMTKTTMVLFPAYTTVITPAAYNEKNAAATTGGVSGTATGAGAAVATTKASTASELVLRSWGASLIVVAVSGLLCF